LATSFSKDLSIPGERLGLVAVSPQAAHREDLLAGFILANRILGFVNAPALMQRVVAQVPGLCVDITPYGRRRDLLGQILREAGYRFVQPQGAFYFFPEAPGGDDLAFVSRLKQENILGVPGRGFGRAGTFAWPSACRSPSSKGRRRGFSGRPKADFPDGAGPGGRSRICLSP
jgi:aspartate aminotransferase